MPSIRPTLDLERAIVAAHGRHHIAGLDEAGRGALAGPVYAAAVILPLDFPSLSELFNKVTDSKLLSFKVRDSLFELITDHVLAYGVGSATAEEVDNHGVVPATKLAMQRALAQLQPPADFLLIDGRIRLPQTRLPQQAVVRGDQHSLSIAAASILAKVSRDRYMIELDGRYPHYSFARHKGYGTQLHRDAIARYGPCPVHRRTFSPVRETLL